MYRRRRALSRLWLLSDPGVVSCNNITTSFGVFRKRRQPKVFHVGLGKQFLTIKSALDKACLLYTSPSPRDATLSRMPSSA